MIIEVKGLGATGFMGNDINVTKLGHTMAEPCIKICGENIPLDDIEKAWTAPLEGVFATKAECENAGMKKFEYGERIIFVLDYICKAARIYTGFPRDEL